MYLWNKIELNIKIVICKIIDIIVELLFMISWLFLFFLVGYLRLLELFGWFVGISCVMFVFC